MTGIHLLIGERSAGRLAQDRRRPANADSRIRLGFKR